MPETLLARALPQLFGVIDRTKKNIASLFANPGDYMAQANAHFGERLQALDKDVTAGFGHGDPAAQERAVQALMTVQPANVGATVWHGSPHLFDKFDSSKIGAGEGAQSFGHGMYFAESPAVAKAYQEALTPGAGSSPADVAARWLKQSGGDADAARAGLRTVMQRAMDAGEDMSSLRAANGLLFEPERLTGAMYKVDLPDDQIARMLNWDEGGQAAWQDAVKVHGSPQAAAEAMRAQGIPGIRYLDGVSRDNGAGTSNFVVFPGGDKMLTILERNGKAVPR